MKHKISVTITLLLLFLITQVIGIFIVNFYIQGKDNLSNIIEDTNDKQVKNELPYGLESEEKPSLTSFIFSFFIALFLIFILMKYKLKSIIRIWFLFVVVMGLSITINAIIVFSGITYGLIASISALIISIILGLLKVFRPTVITHNLTEVLIYPGIAAVLAPIINPLFIIIILTLISIYDVWAVWKSQIMQKMAKYQMEEVRVFGGLLIPSLTKKDKDKIKLLKEKYKNKEIPQNLIKKQKFKVNLAILGGGDIIFPIITAGVFLRYFGIIDAIFVIIGAFIGLTYLLIITQKDKAYPAMPYITIGIFASLIIRYLLIGLS